MDVLEALANLRLPLLARSRVPADLDEIESIGFETPPADVGLSAKDVAGVWESVRALYRTGVYPALQLCIRREGRVVLHRALGHAAGNAPDDPADARKVLATVATPFCIFSASKAVTAIVIHKLDEQRLLHLEDRVAEYIPEFGRHGKHRVTIRHLLCHRAGIPNLPKDSLDLDLLEDPDRILEILCDATPRTRPGRLVAYHAVTGGFVLAEIVRRVTGQDIRSVLRKQIAEPLGLRWLNYGVARKDVSKVAKNAVTGPPVPPPVAQMLTSALGTDPRHAVELSNDPRFLTGVIPSANVVTTAEELSAFYECLLEDGVLDGIRVLDPRTVHHATGEQSIWELDLTLGLPLRYGLGFMLGGRHASLLGWDNPNAFGHLGFTNVFSWADPDRRLSVAMLTSGKPIFSLHVVRLVQLMNAMHDAFPKVPRETAIGSAIGAVSGDTDTKAVAGGGR